MKIEGVVEVGSTEDDVGVVEVRVEVKMEVEDGIEVGATGTVIVVKVLLIITTSGSAVVSSLPLIHEPSPSPSPKSPVQQMSNYYKGFDK